MVSDREIKAAYTAIWKYDWLPPSKCKILAEAGLKAAERARKREELWRSKKR